MKKCLSFAFLYYFFAWSIFAVNEEKHLLTRCRPSCEQGFAEEEEPAVSNCCCGHCGEDCELVWRDGLCVYCASPRSGDSCQCLRVSFYKLITCPFSSLVSCFLCCSYYGEE